MSTCAKSGRGSWLSRVTFAFSSADMTDQGCQTDAYSDQPGTLPVWHFSQGNPANPAKNSQGFGGLGENSQGFLFAGFFRPAVAGRKILRFFDRFSSDFLCFSTFPGLTHAKSGSGFRIKLRNSIS